MNQSSENLIKSFEVYEKRVPENHWVKSNFGKKGWLLIIFMGLMFVFGTGMNADGLNIAVPAITAERNWDYATILAYSTPAGFISVIGSYLLAIVTDKKGARFTTVLCLIVTAASYVWYGNAKTPLQYFIALTLVSIFSTATTWVAGAAYLAMYFPKKKGLALGWATMGNNLCTAAFVPILSMLTAKLGFGGAVVPVAISVLLLTIFAFFLPNNPEDAGTTPDQVPMEAEEIDAYRKASNAYVSPWSYSAMLRCKDMWLVSIVLGFTFLVTVGIVGQMIPRLSGDFGWTTEKAMGAMSVCAIIGIVGSYVWGVIDQKIGTKKAVFYYMIWYGIAAILNVVPSNICLYISLFMIGIAIGGNANWPISLVSSVFGYLNFPRLNILVMPLYTLIRCCTYLVLAVSMRLTNALSGAYVIFGGIALLGAVITLFIDDKRYADGTLGK